MDWESFYSWFLERPWVLAALGILLVVFFVSISTLISLRRSRKRYLEELRNAENPSRIYVLSTKGESYRYFDALSPSSVVGPLPLEDFYSRFSRRDSRRVAAWIKGILEPDPQQEQRDYLEVEIVSDEDKKTFFSLLELDSVNRETGIIHLQSFLFKYVSPRKNAHGKRGVSTRADYIKRMENSAKKKGVTLCFAFAYRRISDRDLPMEPLVVDQVKNVLSPFVKGSRLLLACSDNEFVLVDYHMSPKPDSLRLANEVMTAAKSYLSVNGLSHRIDVHCGIVPHSSFSHSPEMILEHARVTARRAIAENASILFYERGQGTSLDAGNLEIFRSEVERVIQSKNISVSFRPIYDVQGQAVFGYQVRSLPINSHFQTMEELHDYASRMGDDQHLFAAVARSAFPVFASENTIPHAKLFYPVYLEDHGAMLSTFSRMAEAKDVDVVFLFHDKDVRVHLDPEKEEDLMLSLKDIKAKGHRIGLLLEEGELTLPSEIYAAYDYFVCGFGFAGAAAEMDAKIRSQLHSLVEKLLKYKKPIIASDIDGWDAVEIIVRSGVNYISSDALCPYEPMVTVPNSKAVKRIQNMRE